MAEDPTYDVAEVRVHPETHEPRLVAFVKERRDYLVLDPAVADDVAALRALEPGDLSFAGRDRADRVWLAAYTNDDGPVRYHAYDRDSRQARFLFEHQPALSQFTLAPDGAVRVHGARRARGARLPDVPARAARAASCPPC